MNDNDQVVCVIDDDVSARESIAGLARSAGLDVEGFASAQEYLAAPRTVPPGCLVLDVNMPGLTGLELQERLWQARIDVPIVVVSGHGDVSMSVQALKAGALDFLTKPFDPDVLLAAISAAMGEAAPAEFAGTERGLPERRGPLAKSSWIRGSGVGSIASIVGASDTLDEV